MRQGVELLNNDRNTPRHLCQIKNGEKEPGQACRGENPRNLNIANVPENVGSSSFGVDLIPFLYIESTPNDEEP